MHSRTYICSIRITVLVEDQTVSVHMSVPTSTTLIWCSILPSICSAALLVAAYSTDILLGASKRCTMYHIGEFLILSAGQATISQAIFSSHHRIPVSSLRPKHPCTRLRKVTAVCMLLPFSLSLSHSVSLSLYMCWHV